MKVWKSLAFFLCAVTAAPQQALYEEEPAATRRLRDGLYRQLNAFIDGLEDDPATILHLLRTRLGYPPPWLSPSPGKPRMEKIGEDAIGVYYRCSIEVAPKLDTYGLYIVPKGLKGKAPLVISKHGGGGYPELALFMGGANYHDMIRGAVREGYVVWAPLTVMYPYRDRDHGTAVPVEVRRDLDEKLRAAGSSLMGLEAARISRSLDSLLAARKEIDGKRIAMVGLSYGGFYTLYTAALDPRIKAAVASCSFRNGIVPTGSGKPEGRPHDLPGPELAALIAPRALQVQAGINDKGLPIDDVRAGAARTKAFYVKARAESMFEFAEFNGGHEWRGDLAWAFLRRQLGRP